MSSPSGQYVSDLGIPALGKNTADKKAAINDYFDSVEDSLFENCLLRLVAAFEWLAFEKLKNAVGTARATIGQHFPALSVLSCIRAAREGRRRLSRPWRY